MMFWMHRGAWISPWLCWLMVVFTMPRDTCHAFSIPPGKKSTTRILPTDSSSSVISSEEDHQQQQQQQQQQQRALVEEEIPSSPTFLDRRGWLQQTSTTAILGASVLFGGKKIIPAANAVERAVGGAEIECRAKGNCLETGEWDGAIGWNWGAKDRCDATDPKCGVNGQLLESGPVGAPVPTLAEGNSITHTIRITCKIGKSSSASETGTLALGLYDKACPTLVQQFLDFCDPDEGLVSNPSDFDSYVSVPVSLQLGGLMTLIEPLERIDFGIPSQSNAYARSRNLSKAGDEFRPLGRPKKVEDSMCGPAVRPHNAAGLVSVPGKGLGYGGTGFEQDNEAYGSAFQITAASVPAMDKEGRKVIGQLMDDSSMQLLARLASLPTRKGFKGVVPGQNSGPPLIKVSVTQVTVERQKSQQAGSSD